jgi:hypothetical protein
MTPNRQEDPFTMGGHAQGMNNVLCYFTAAGDSK